ncbi:DUF896 domain-containing protein [Tenuibacillus multivorans]|uniref:UPF0291 protein SAMN05216498_2532 n=1 Tax=Tenuibacillus multivorans TaxID=237069 RepID=A0A1H0CGQ2_9BACI|nr:DUF896 domain-containing protein [Tenuibacillus multivorans]GEL76302.1 UPF0291 protein YnzC [Tenuibacillus multivorans]SDN57056.1 Uncharacterized protein YnzC, UPF0291/DUF896 family [Tenuibacillus multivorans]
MISEDRLKRINELAKKSKNEGLTDKEKKEQKKLREEYLKAFRQSFKNQLHSLKVVDPEGTDVTPDTLKKEQKNQSKH